MSLAVRELLSPGGTSFTADGTYTFPAGITKVRAFLWGAGGGTGTFAGGIGGAGAYLAVDIPRGARTTLTIQLNRGRGGAGPVNGGGFGGGYSAVTTAGDGIIALAGGGGGSGGGYFGGGGGFFNGGQGGNATQPGSISTAFNFSHGGGGSQTVGGAGGSSPFNAGFISGNPGTSLQGGNANTGSGFGGGGGGGLFGGGGGGGDANQSPFTGMGAGGGGSSFVSAVATLVEGQAGPNGALGGVNPGGISSPYYIAPFGANNIGGLVVIVPFLPLQQMPPQLFFSQQTVINQINTYSGTGAVQTFSVPAGVFSIKFFLWGAGGIGQNGNTSSGNSGAGAYVEGNLITRPGTTYHIIVGRPGLTGLPNGGGTTAGTGAGGGGFSGLFSATPAVATVIAIAGGGAGSGFNGGGNGGAGGFPNGFAGNGSGTQGGGGTQTAGGTSLVNVGTQLAGGNGAGGDGGGGGGGGGWWGGGGGTGQRAGGGGSSTFTALVINPFTENGNSGSVSPPNPKLPGGTGRGYWLSPAGSGGQAGSVRIGYSIVYSNNNIHTYKYVRFTVNQARGGSTAEYQLSEFQLLLRGAFVSYAGATISPNTTGAEGSIRVFDGNLGTKYFAVGQGNNFVLTSPTNFVFDSYTWGTANDVPDRDPVRWSVEGSADNSTWTMLDDKSQSIQTVTTSRQTYLPTIQLPALAPSQPLVLYSVPQPETLLQTFTATGAVQNYTIPAGTFRIKIYAWGSGGGNGSGAGGGGAFVSGALNVRPGQLLYIVVGSVNNGTPSIGQGGGGGRMGKYYGAGGGGFSGVFLGSSPASDNCICIAAGGGAGNVNSAGGPAIGGGPGGFPNGFSGNTSGARIGGGGATQIAGGAGAGGGVTVNYSGIRLFGGDGNTTLSDGGYGGGWGSGGGGWFGGGASVQNATNAGGGGGSSYIGGLLAPIETGNGGYPPSQTGTATAGGESSPYWTTPRGRSGQSGYLRITRYQ